MIQRFEIESGPLVYDSTTGYVVESDGEERRDRNEFFLGGGQVSFYDSSTIDILYDSVRKYE